MIHLWLCYVLEVSEEYCHFVIRKFKAARGRTVPWVRSSLMDNSHPAPQLDFPPTPVVHLSLSNTLASGQTHTTRPSTFGNHKAATNATFKLKVMRLLLGVYPATLMTLGKRTMLK